jgi:hypothetical protein
MPHLNASQNRYLRLFTRYVDIDSGTFIDRRFRDDVMNLRNSGIDDAEYRSIIKNREGSTPFSQFLQKYEFPYLMANFLRKFILENRIEPQLIHSGVFLVSEIDESATGYNKHKEGYSLYSQARVDRDANTFRPELKLVIPAGVKLNEVKEFLDENWGSFVQPRMRLYEYQGSAPNRRIRSRSIAPVESRIVELKDHNKTSAEIAIIINQEFNTSYTYNSINQIFYRMNHK